MRARPERRFWFTLALALGCTVRELQARMSAAEFAEWLAYYQVSPFGEQRADLRAGIIAATLANAWRGKGKPPAKPRDFMPRFGERGNKVMTQEEIEAALDRFCNVFKAVNRGNDR